jgi:putative ABC transport system permease protein
VVRLGLRNVFARRGRMVLVTGAVVIGVAIVCGTLVFTDTIRAAFRQQFLGSSTGAELVISSLADEASSISAPAAIPDSLVRRIRQLAGVSAAAGQIRAPATIVGRNGKVITTLGATAQAVSYLRHPFTGLQIVAGHPPRGPTEVAIDESTAEREHFRLGETVPVVTAQPEHTFTISGIVRYAGAALGGGPLAVFSLPTARALYGRVGKVDLIYVALTDGASTTATTAAIRRVIGRRLVVRSAAAQADAELQSVTSRLTSVTGGLLAFGIVAALLGAFAVFNALSIAISQRSREFALLRALGSTRRQLLVAVVAEAAVLGLIGSVIGLGVGFGIAAAIRAVFSAAGQDLPSADLVLSVRTVLVGLGGGVAISVAAGLLPAWRATRVAPLEALRTAEPAPPERRGLRRASRLAVPAVLAAAGVGVAFGLRGNTANGQLAAGIVGAVMLLAAAIALVPELVASFSGIASRPLDRRGGISARLALENAVRNPARTAAGASGLMVGIALVLFVTVYANGVRTSSRQAVARNVLGDFTIQNRDGTSSFPAAVAMLAQHAPGVVATSAIRTAPARIGRSGSVTATGIDPNTIGDGYRFDWVDGSNAAVVDLSDRQVLVERQTALAAGLHVGSRTVITTETGLGAPVVVAGIYRDPALLQGFVLPVAHFDRLFAQRELAAVFVRLGPGASAGAAATALRHSLRPFPGVIIRSLAQLRNAVGGRVHALVLLLYAFLALSVLLALLSIVNTLTLSIHSRTRELGLLRAVGMTPAQASAMIRFESLITGILGTVVGTIVGLAISWVVAHALTAQGIAFAVPWLVVVAALVLGILAGLLAALIPAARAARIDVLAAIAYE